MAEEDYFKARTAAGRAAVSIANDKSVDVAAEMVRGAWAGFLLASAELEGWDSVLHHVQQLASAARVPGVIEKPNLRCVQGGKIS